jgi:antitoxin MazE
VALRIARWGNSLAVRLPKTLIHDAGLKEGDEVEAVVAEDGTVTLHPCSRRESLDDLVKRITPQNRHDETDWGPAVGRETW